MWVLLSMTCHVKEHTLSLYLWVVVRKKSEGEDKVKNDAKQKKCMGTKNKYKI